MLYNKNQFRKTNDKKVLHKIGKHWVTVSVAFLSLLGLGAVSTTATTHADTTDNANAQTTSAAPSNSADSIQKQVTKQANALHNQLLGHAAVSQKPAQQGTARLGSVNGRVNKAQSQNAQQNNKPAANNQMSANHSNVMRLGSTPTQASMVDPVHPNIPVHQLTALSGSYNGVNYNVYSDMMTPENTTNKSKWIVPANASDWAKTPKADRSDSYGTYTYLTKDNYKTSRSNKFNKFKSKYFNPNSSSYGKATVKTTYSAPKYNDYQIEFTSGSISNMNAFMSDVTSGKNVSNSDIVGITFDKGINTSNLKDMSNAFGGTTNLRSVTGLDNINTSKVTSLIGLFQYDTKLDPSSNIPNQIHKWRFNQNPSSNITLVSDGESYTTPADANMLSDTGKLGLNYSLVPTTTAPYSFNVNSYVHSDTYDGLNYTYNSNTNEMKFTGGTLSYPIYENGTFPADTKQSGIVGAFSQPGEEAPRVNQQIVNDFNNVQNISFGSNVSLGTNTNLMGMFYNMPKLQSVDMSNIKPDSNNIKNMSYMFSNDPSLTSVTFPKNINLSHVTNMNNMFSYDYDLNHINFGNGFEHIGNAPSDHGVTMDSMFQYAGNRTGGTIDTNNVLQETNASDENTSNKFDTSNVTSMASMFEYAGFTELQLPDSFNTHKVTNMSNMFNGTKIIPDPYDNVSDDALLNLGKNFSTSDVTNMSGMFANESNLPVLDLASDLKVKNDDGSVDHHYRVGFNTSKVTDMSNMFLNDGNLYSIIFPNTKPGFDTSNVTNMNGMFENVASAPNANWLNLTLPKNFYVNGSSQDMFKNTVFNSLTLQPSGKIDPTTKDPLTNTKFSDKTVGISTIKNTTNHPNGSLYMIKTPSGQFNLDQDGSYVTLDSPASFNSGLAGTFTQHINAPKYLAYSDAYSDIDGHLGWRLPKSQVPINTKDPVVLDTHGKGLKGDWAFLDSDGYPTTDYDSIHIVNHRAKVVPLYHGLVVKYNKAKNSVEFTYGHVYKQSLNGFDDPNKPSDQVTPENGHYTIAYAVKHANTLTFDGYNMGGPNDPNAGYPGTVISDIPDMSYMFANPNLYHINFNGVFNMSDTTKMVGMFQGANISDLVLPKPETNPRNTQSENGFNTKDVYINVYYGADDSYTSDNAEKNMFSMPRLKELDIDFNPAKTNSGTYQGSDYDASLFASDTGLSQLYKITGKTSIGQSMTSDKNDVSTSDPNNPGKLLDEASSSDQGSYLTTKQSIPVSHDTIEFDYNNKKVGSIAVNNTFAGVHYVLTHSDTNTGIYNNSDANPILNGYKFAKNGKTGSLQYSSNSDRYVTFQQNNQVDHVNVQPIINSTYVDYVYKNKVGHNHLVSSDVIKGNVVSDTTINSANVNKYGLTSGWILAPQNSVVNVPHIDNSNLSPQTIYVVPKPVTVNVQYVDQSDGNKVVGNTTLRGYEYNKHTNKFLDGDYSDVLTSRNDTGLSSDYNLINPDNHIEYYNGSQPVYVKRAYSTSEPINYDYGKDIVGTSTATSFTGAANSKSANVMAGIPGGYHLVSGASSTVADTGHTSSVAVTPNTITENISYAVQNDPRFSTANDSFSGFASVINDERTSQYGNTSFEITNDNQANTIPNGYQLVSDYKVGPVATNSASSSATHTLQVAPEWEGIHVLFEDPDYNVLGEFADSGFAGNSLSKPIADAYPAEFKLPHVDQILSGKENSEWAYIRNSDLPTKFVPGYGDETIRIVEHPIYATDTINYVDETNNNNKVDSATITGIENVPNPTINITNSYKPGLTNNYVLANNSTTVTYDGKSYDVPVVPNNNVFTVNYQYNGQTVGTQAFNGKKPTDTLVINSDNEKGLPAGYSLIDQHNAYGNKFVYAEKSGNVAIQPNQVSDTINFMNGNQKVGSTTVSGNDYRATAAGNNQAEIDNDTPGVPSNYYVVNNPIAVNYDGGTHNVNVAPDEDVDTVNYQYNNNTVASYQFEAAQGSHIDITNDNQPDIPNGYHLVNKDNQFTVNSSNHNVQITPDTMTFTVTFTSKGKPVATKTYQGATDSKFKVNSATDTPAGYTINGNQNVNFKFDGDEANDNASLAVTPIPPKYATETINFLYTNNAAGKVFSEGATKKSNLQGSQGTIMSSDYTNINPGYQVIPDENKFNKGSKYTFDNGSVNIYVEPIPQTDTIWYVNDQTGKLIANDGPFADTISKTGNDSRATDANNTSFVIGANPSDLSTDYYRVDNPGQSIPFDGQKHVVSVHLIKQSPYAAQASQAAKTKAAKAAQAATSASISAQASKIAKEQNSKAASSYSSSATSNATSSMASSTTNSVTSTNDSSEYNHEQSSNSSISSSASSSASASQSSANSSSNSSIASQSTSFSSASVAPRSSAIPQSASSSVAPSSSAESITPFIPIMPNSVPSSVASSSASSVASQSAQPVSSSAAPVTLTNKNYPITYAKSANKPDMVTVMGHKYPVHYHADGKNTVRVRERIMKHGKRSYRYKNVVVSTNLPIAHPASDNEVRDVDRIDFRHVNKRAWTAKGLNKVLDSAKPGEVISYHGKRLAVVHDPIHWRYFMVTKSALAHILVTSVGRKNTKDLLNARHTYTIFIKHIVAVHGRKANYVRYEFSFKHRNYWVTGRKDFVPNSYWQKRDFEARHTHYVRVIRPCRLYKSTKYNRLTFIRNVRRGTLARVAKVVYINRPSYEQTRLVLTNGRYITANKNFVRIVK